MELSCEFVGGLWVWPLSDWLDYLQMTMRLDMYGKEISDACRPDFKPQAVYEPSN